MVLNQPLYREHDDTFMDVDVTVSDGMYNIATCGQIVGNVNIDNATDAHRKLWLSSTGQGQEILDTTVSLLPILERYMNIISKSLYIATRFLGLKHCI